MKNNNNLIALILVASIILFFIGTIKVINQSITGKALGINANISIQIADYCGNNNKGSSESCDGTDLNSKTCVTQGFASGTLSCTASCAFDTSNCVAAGAPTGGAGGGGGGGGGGGSTITYDFDLSPEAIKLLLKLGEKFQKQITTKNTGDTILFFQVSTDLQDIISIDEPSFELRQGQEKTITLTFLTFDSQKIGVNVGNILIKAGALQRQLPVILELESKKVLFDISLNIPAQYRQILPDSNLSADITILNMHDIKNAPVLLLYSIKDFSGKTILEENETIILENQISFAKIFHIPTVKPGTYVLAVLAKYQDSVGTASETFDIIEKIHIEKPIQLKRDYTLLLIILILIIANIVYYQHYKLKNIEKYQSKKLKYISEQYNKKETKERFIALKHKLNRQLQLLEKAYREGYIKRDTYKKCKQRIFKALKGINH